MIAIGDGRNDIIWGHGHGYGLYWEERRDDNRDGSTNWRHHLIDDKISQFHSLAWEDLDNDGRVDGWFTNGMVRELHGADLTQKMLTRESLGERVRIARASRTSMTNASPGSRSTMKLTTQSPQAVLARITQVSQLISMASITPPPRQPGGADA